MQPYSPREGLLMSDSLETRLGRSKSWCGYPGPSCADNHEKTGVQLGSSGVLWTLGDVVPQSHAPVRLPLASFNHIAREVLSLDKSKRFYVDILGFEVGPRPPFDSDGYWLYGYGLSLHLVQTTAPDHRRLLKHDRIKYFKTCLPRVDHIAFITSDLSIIRKTLIERKVYYKEDKPGGTEIEQIFFFDPDGNVIEVSNCARPEQQCSLAAASTVASPEPGLEDVRIPSPGIPRSPSHIYINGQDVIIATSPPATFASFPAHLVHHHEPEASMHCALGKAMQNLPTLQAFLPPVGSAVNARGQDEEVLEGDQFYFFDESFDFEDDAAAEGGAAVVLNSSSD